MSLLTESKVPPSKGAGPADGARRPRGRPRKDSAETLSKPLAEAALSSEAFDEFLRDNEYTIELLPNAYELYLAEIANTKILDPTRVRALVDIMKSGSPEESSKAFFTLVECNLRYVLKCAIDMRGPNIDVLDLISEGNIGLMVGVERYNPEHPNNANLLTYARFRIEQKMLRFIQDHGSTIRIPVYLHYEIWSMFRAGRELEKKLEREPTNDEIAETLGTTEERIEFLKTKSQLCLSLEDPRILEFTGGTAVEEFAAETTDGNSTYEAVERAEAYQILDDLIELLDPRERRILEYRFGMNGREEKTLDELGEKFAVSRERIRQIQNIALSVLRKKLENIYARMK